MTNIGTEVLVVAGTEQPMSASDLDALELHMLAVGSMVELPLTHRFTPGIYTREIFMPAGTLATSKIHKIEHPYVVTKGRVSVYIPGVGVEHITAPYFGITKAGTRRVLYMHEDTVWITFHPNNNDETDLEEIENYLIERRELPDGSTAYEQYAALLEITNNNKELVDSFEEALVGGTV